MKHRITLLLTAILFAAANTYAVTDTLRNYAVSGSIGVGPNYYFSAVTFPKQYQRFLPPAPGYIKTIILTLGGNAFSGTVTLRLFGHEGGTDFPQIQKDLVAPLTFTKTVTGVQKVAVDLPNPLWMDTHQFFVMATDFTSSAIRLLSDKVNHPATCSSPSGGNYYVTYLSGSSGNYYSENALAIDVVMDYPDGTTSPQYLKNITNAAGIATNLGNSSVAWSDINNDNYPDLLVSGKLYKNRKDGTFTDITASAGITSSFYATTFIDMNNDGKDDILFLYADTAGNVLYINNGDETFTKTPLHLATQGFPAGIQAIAVADYNNDGYPDLFVGQLWKTTVLQDAANTNYEEYFPHHLYLNDKNLGFIDTTSLIKPMFINQYGLVSPPDSTSAHGKIIGTNRAVRGAQWVDYNNDGHMDLYIANYRLQPDELWENNGDGTFTEVAYDKGIDVNNFGGSGHGTGCDWGDYNNDGYMDLLLPQLAHPAFTVAYDHRPTTIYKNNGDGSFTDLNPGVNAGDIGIEFEETHAGGTWGDLNNDGLLDFAICSFYGCRYSSIYIQKSDHTFQQQSFSYGINNVVSDADVILVDYDNDGKLDYAGGVNEGKFALFKNQIPFWGNFVELNLVSTSGNKKAIGAKVEVYTNDGKRHMQYQMPYHGAKMSKGNTIHFGLGGYPSQVDSVVVRWPNGTLQTEKFTGVAINHFNTLTEGGQVVIGIRENENHQPAVTVYPNPFSSYTTLEISGNIPLAESGNYQVLQLSVFDLVGQKVQQLNITNQKSTIQKDNLPTGIYFYKLTRGNETLGVGKLVIQ